MIHSRLSDSYLVQYPAPTTNIDKTIKPNVSGKAIFKVKSSLAPERIQFMFKDFRKLFFHKIKPQFSLRYDIIKLLDICCVSVVDGNWSVS